jgi:hypothetical protein
MNTHPDELLDHVLHALRDTNPEAGLEGRILSRLDHAAKAQSHPSAFAAFLHTARHPFLWSPTQARYAFAAAALLLVGTTSILVSRTRQQSPATVYTRPTQPFALPQTSPSGTPAPEQPRLVQARSIHHSPAPTSQTPSLSSTPTDPDAIALAETLAPSHPAPRMPLTQQEALMLSVLHSGDQEEIAALNPIERDAVFAREKAAYQEFFTPQPDTQTGDTE